MKKLLALLLLLILPVSLQAALTDIKFGQYQIADTQWNTTACLTTTTCQIYRKDPGIAYKIPYTIGRLVWATDDYIQLELSGDSNYPYIARQYSSNGSLKETMGTGKIINMGVDYFFFVGNDNNTGTLFSGSSGMDTTDGVTWTGTLNPTEQEADTYADNNYSTEPLAPGESAPSFQCDAIVDIWYANDESGSVSAAEFTKARDFIYQVTDGFYHNSVNGAQSGLVGWAYGAKPINVVMPITQDFSDPDDSGLATTGTTVDGDGLGVREAYTVKVDNSGGTHLANATQGLADLINAGNGRRTGVPQVAVFLTDAPSYQINNVSSNGGGTAWEAAAANLRAAGPDGVRIVLVLLAEAADAYSNNAASKATIEAVIDSTGFIIQTSDYASVADEANGYIDQVVNGTCGAATFPASDDYSDAPADGLVAPNGTNTTAYGEASHSITSDLQLGATVTPDTESVLAADDASDDAITSFPPLSDLDRTYSVNTLATNQTGSTARMIAWIDFDGNGTFDPDEAAIRSIPTGTANGTVTLNWSNIPLDIQTGSTYMRLRLTTESINNREPDGTKSNGEVEDYAITITSSGATVSGRVYIDTNSNAVNDSGENGIGNTVVILHDTATNTCRSVRTTGSGNYYFSGVSNGGYNLYQAHGETTPTPQTCGPSFANNPPGYVSTTADTFSVMVTGSTLANQNFGEVAGTTNSTSVNPGAGITFAPNHQSEVLPGNVVFYSHVFTSEASGGVRFTTAGVTTIQGWTHILYRDADCNGTLNDSEGSTSVSGINFGSGPGTQLCIINKVYAPANVPAQDQYLVTTIATFTYTSGQGGAASPITLQVTDLTTAGQSLTPATQSTPAIGESRLVLTKKVINLDQAGAVEVATLNQAKPGDLLQYRIYYRNTGIGPITDLEINDNVPEYTVLESNTALCNTPPTGMICTPNINAETLNWQFTGDPLVGGAGGYVSYEVRVNY